MRIFKYPLDVTDRQFVSLPRGAKPLCVQTQGATPCLWAMVDPDAPLYCHTVLTIGTGNPMPSGVGEYIGTYQMSGGALVWHVFLEAAPADKR